MHTVSVYEICDRNLARTSLHFCTWVDHWVEAEEEQARDSNGVVLGRNSCYLSLGVVVEEELEARVV